MTRKKHFNKKQKRKTPPEIEMGEYLLGRGIQNINQLQEVFENSYALIPIEVLQRKDLNSTDKIVYGELRALSRRKGYCYATNEYIAKKVGLSKRTIPAVLKRLKNKEMVKVNLQKNGNGTFRKVTIKKGVKSNEGGERSKATRGTLRNDAKRETNIKETNTKESSMRIEPDGSTSPEEFGSERINNLLSFLENRFRIKEFVDSQNWKRKYAHITLRDYKKITIIRTAEWICEKWSKPPVKMKSFYYACKEYKAKHPELYGGGGAVLMENE